MLVMRLYLREQRYIYERSSPAGWIAVRLSTLTCSKAVRNVSVGKRNLQVDSHRDQPHTTSGLETGSRSLAKTED
jgi:hypothetical protein